MRSRVCVMVLLGGCAAACADPAASVDTILAEIEAYGAKVEDIHCGVVFTEEDRISDDVTTRTGTILFKRREPNPIFLVAFEKSVQDGRVNRKKSWFRFDGRYFYEAYERSKSVIRRDLAPPGTVIDLFSMDKAPFPIPFGQKKDEILKHFDVVLENGNADDGRSMDHLICTPKPESRFARNYTRMEFFVSRALHLPIRIVMTANPPDKVTTADFADLSEGSINTGLADARFELPPETRGYTKAEE